MLLFTLLSTFAIDLISGALDETDISAHAIQGTTTFLRLTSGKTATAYEWYDFCNNNILGEYGVPTTVFNYPSDSVVWVRPEDTDCQTQAYFVITEGAQSATGLDCNPPCMTIFDSDNYFGFTDPTPLCLGNDEDKDLLPCDYNYDCVLCKTGDPTTITPTISTLPDVDQLLANSWQYLGGIKGGKSFIQIGSFRIGIVADFSDPSLPHNTQFVIAPMSQQISNFYTIAQSKNSETGVLTWMDYEGSTANPLKDAQLLEQPINVYFTKHGIQFGNDWCVGLSGHPSIPILSISYKHEDKFYTFRYFYNGDMIVPDASALQFPMRYYSCWHENADNHVTVGKYSSGQQYIQFNFDFRVADVGPKIWSGKTWPFYYISVIGSGQNAHIFRQDGSNHYSSISGWSVVDGKKAPFSPEITMYGYCSGDLSIRYYRSDLGTFRWLQDTELIDMENGGGAKTAVLTNICTACDVVKLMVYCQNQAGPGGLIFSIKYNGIYYSTNPGSSNNYYKLTGSVSLSNGGPQSDFIEVEPTDDVWEYRKDVVNLKSFPYYAKYAWTCGANRVWDCPEDSNNLWEFDINQLFSVNTDGSKDSCRA